MDELIVDVNKKNNLIDRRNFRNVQIDAIAIGLTNAAAPFLPVFLSRLNATTFEISLLTTMPGITGLLLALPIGHFLESKKNIVSWFSTARLLYILSYSITGLAAFFLKGKPLVVAILVIWALATLPQTLLNITFPVVMNAVAGPNRRYELMSRRWSILGITTSITVFLIGQILEWLKFPFNYQIVFLGLSVSGITSFLISRQITIPDSIPSKELTGEKNIFQNLANTVRVVTRQKPFCSFILRRFVYLTGVSLTIPLFPIYYVRSVHAPDSWIAAFATIQTSIIVIGYIFWSRKSQVWGARNVLLITTGMLCLYPVLTALTSNLWIIAIYAGISGIFQGGLDLVFFDELMKTIPQKSSAFFVSVAQGFQFLSAILAPIIGTLITDYSSIGAGLIFGGLFRFAGFLLFFFEKIEITPQPQG